MNKKLVPLRIDFAGGWLDVPEFARADGYIVNLAITPGVSLEDLARGRCSGLGGSAAKSILEGNNAVLTELASGAGWQDPAIITETGLCVWQSGPLPRLVAKYNPTWLVGRLAVLWVGERTAGAPAIARAPRDFDAIVAAAVIAQRAVDGEYLPALSSAVYCSYRAQVAEGMHPLPSGGLAHKYCGAGFGGNAMYLFEDSFKRRQFLEYMPTAYAVEPFMESFA
jgi:hypothetical protein